MLWAHRGGLRPPRLPLQTPATRPRDPVCFGRSSSKHGVPMTLPSVRWFARMAPSTQEDSHVYWLVIKGQVRNGHMGERIGKNIGRGGGQEGAELLHGPLPPQATTLPGAWMCPPTRKAGLVEKGPAEDLRPWSHTCSLSAWVTGGFQLAALLTEGASSSFQGEQRTRTQVPFLLPAPRYPFSSLSLSLLITAICLDSIKR